ncbi:low molecular weight protein-tyrosine-phosphatase [Pseudogulbenkiania subflava]|uniref:protein-tyrosine-phosphatase n=1 Tax=Pseudogulbenkiania subflava DSM 22618 TaxID=1123014 RepID=A0A1Y6BR71_9NEIS|nr:low molecular weight protein-tyrosine-phosphatase [Pseudogulbenkiania subflava]SMF24857.1 protein-tyrosine phosphatase [Pseudogulbenkiania subflava DSM 22618]
MTSRSILFVCHGNICRSPTAEGVMRAKLERLGLASSIEVDSAGTHGYHVGEAPDQRSQQAARRRGYDLSAQRARQVIRADFERFDLVLAADQRNLAALRQLCPPGMQHKLALMLAPLGPNQEVPDPYYGGVSGFDRVLDLLEAACDAWLARLQQAETPP